MVVDPPIPWTSEERRQLPPWTGVKPDYKYPETGVKPRSRISRLRREIRCFEGMRLQPAPRKEFHAFLPLVGEG